MKFLTTLFLVAFIGCKTQPIVVQKQAPDTGKNLTYLALGDSYTIGASVPEAERFPVQLVKALNAQGMLVSAPRIIATSGWTTDELKAGIADARVTSSYDLVSLLIGVNNQFRGRSRDEFRREFADLLRQAIVFSGNNSKNVFVVSIPDYGVTPFGKSRGSEKIGQEIDEFNAICREEAQRLNVDFYDITPISRRAKDNPSLVADDNLHPSGVQYAAWVQEILAPALIEKLLKTK